MTSFRTSASTSTAWTAPSIWCWRRRARPIPRSTCRFIRAGGISSRTATIAGRRIADQTAWPDRAARARAEFDLAIVSVFLDAGAGPSWRYRDPKTGIGDRPFGRIGTGQPCHVRRRRVLGQSAASRCAPMPRCSPISRLPISSAACRSRDANPLVGLEGRVDLLRRLGQLVASKPDIFGSHDTPRPGGLFDRLAIAGRRTAAFPLPSILSELLQQLGPIWPSRLTLGGIALGDCWKHPALTTADATSGLMPLHKLSQWLAYSLIEPLQTAGIEVTDIDGLTGLAEYRNGGLFVDTGVLDVSRCRRCAARARGRLAAGGGMARADGGAARPPRRRRAASGSGSMPRRCRWQRFSKADLGRGPTAGARAPRRRFAAGESHQRRHGILD